MSVYIKGFKMPESCARCPLEHMDNDPMVFWCSAIKTEFNGNRTEWAREHKTRRKDCPLVPVPPHGRLIDADAMQKEWFNLNFDRKITDGTLAYWNFQLSKIPTIIEAEEEE